MRIFLLSLCVFVFSLSGGFAHAADPADFQIRVQVTSSKVILTGLSGCDWKQKSFRRSDISRKLLVTDSLVALSQGARPAADDDFAFTLEPGRFRAGMTAVRGMAWRSVGWWSTPCDFVVDSHGVSYKAVDRGKSNG